MKQVIRITVLFSGITIAGLLSGCTFPVTKEDVTKNTTEFNLVAERAGNEMLLLNIIRASKRRPMYFTSIGKLTRNMNFTYGTGGISIPFGRIGGGLDGSYSISPNASYSNTPIVDVSVLDTKEFTNGIMSPIPMKTIEYYWSQGWHPEMLLHLFIRCIEITVPNDPNKTNDPNDPSKTNDPNDPSKTKSVKKTYINYPGDKGKFADFQKEIQVWKWKIEKDKDTSIGEVDVKMATHLKELIEAKKAGFTLTPVNGNRMKLCLSEVNYHFTRKPNEAYRNRLKKKIGEIKKKIEETKEMKEQDKKRLKKEMEKLVKEMISFEKLRPQTVEIGDSSSGENEDEPQNTDSNSGKKVEIKVYLRSPEAILYYLGEILRTEMRAEEAIKKKKKEITPEDLKKIAPIIYAGFGECGDCPARLFYARKVKDKKITDKKAKGKKIMDKEKKPCVSVDYEGTKYVIPGDNDSPMGCCTDRSMHVLSLISLLIGQQKKSAETPTTATVSVIGR